MSTSVLLNLASIFTAEELEDLIERDLSIPSSLEKSWQKKDIPAYNLENSPLLTLVQAHQQGSVNTSTFWRKLNEDTISFLDRWLYAIRFFHQADRLYLMVIASTMRILGIVTKTKKLATTLGREVFRQHKLLPKNKAQAYFLLAYLNSITNFESSLAQDFEDALNILSSIRRYFTIKQDYREYINYWKNRGYCYSNRSLGNQFDNMEQALRCYKKAEKVCLQFEQLHTIKHIWDLLGLTYWSRLKGNRADNVDKAISYLERALQEPIRKSAVISWARTHNNLGIVYGDRIRGDRTENIEKAIFNLEQVLSVSEQIVEDDLNTLAKCHNNLGINYHLRLRGEKAENIEKSIHHFQQGLTLCPQELNTNLWAQLHNNLALVHQYRIHGNRSENVARAIHHFQIALEIYSPEKYPGPWATVQHNLGICFNRLKPDHSDENVKAAINHFQNALTVRSREKLPEKWAQTQTALASTYFYRVEKEERVRENAQKAVLHYQNALEVFTSTAYPIDHLGSMRTLGEMYLLLGDVQRARNTLLKSLQTFESIYPQLITHEGFRSMLQYGAPTYFLAAYCSALQNSLEQAMVCMYRGKTRALSEKMALDRAVLNNLPAKDRRKYKALVKNSISLEAELRILSRNGRDFLTITGELKNCRSQLQSLIQEIKSYHPHFLETRISIPELRSIIPGPHAAFVEFCVTTYGTAIIVVLDGAAAEDGWIDISSEFKRVHLEQLAQAWLKGYHSLKNSSHVASAHIQWEKQAENILQNLYETVFRKTDEKLKQRGIRRIIFSPHRSLHILPLHIMSRSHQNKMTYLLEDYEISYCPSALVLRHTKGNLNGRSRGKRVTTLAAVSNPTHDLKWAGEEVQAVAHYFHKVYLLEGKNAHKERVFQVVPRGHYIHLACHGKFDPIEPERSGVYLAPRYEVLHNTSRSIASSVHHKAFTRSISFKIPKTSHPGELLSLIDISSKLKLKRTRLVVLSACETGLVDTLGLADEFIGLPAGFLVSGAQAVISSLWLVEDESTKELMISFYSHHLEQGLAPAAALRIAQLEMLQQNKSPFYWAAFVLQGS